MPHWIYKCSNGPKRANNSRRLVILTKHPLPKQINERSLFDSNLYKPRLANNAVHILIQGTELRDIHIEYSKQFKRNFYLYVFRQSGLFWAVLKLL